MSVTVLVILGALAGGLILVGGVLIELADRGRPPQASRTARADSFSRSDTRDSAALTVLGVVAALAMVVCLGVVALGVAVSSRASDGAVSDDVADLCAGIGRTASIDHRPAAPRPYRVAVVDHDGDQHEWHNRLPDLVRADAPDAIDALACVTEDREMIVEDCPYYPYSFAGTDESETVFSVQRIAIYNDVFLLNPASGEVFAVLRVWGTAPEACSAYKMGERDSVTPEHGEPPEFTTFYAELGKAIQ